MLPDVLQSLPEASRKILEVALEIPLEGVYLVGGILRDMLLGVAIEDNDLDFVVEGPAESFVRSMQQHLEGRLSHHATFGTFSLKTDHFVVDITTARAESYRYPGTLPTVTFSDIYHDLYRRDFSLNALALRLRPLELLDPYQGLEDLQHKRLRILHPASFLDDPTRILRGARLAGRLGLNWEQATWDKIAEALSSAAMGNISKERMKADFERCLAERQVLPVLQELERCNILKRYFGLEFVPQTIKNLDRYRNLNKVPKESYLLAMLMHSPRPAFFLERFHYPLHHLESLKRLEAALNHLGSELFPRLTPTEIWVLRALNHQLAQKLNELQRVFSRRRLSGKDVLDLGLLSGPDVGKILAHVNRARDTGQISGYEEELELARQLVTALQERQ